jgi:glutamate-1-semialdehyde 2,1-aminomutase
MFQTLERQPDARHIKALFDHELARFEEARPRSAALRRNAARVLPAGVPMARMASVYDHPVIYVDHGEGARFTDVDGHSYLDVNLVDSSSFCGFAPEPVAVAIADRARRGVQFLLADEDSLAVADQLAGRFGMPKWQLTLSASQANTEAIRLARTVTGRDRVLVFDGKYHGMLDETLVLKAGSQTVPEYAGVSRHVGADSIVVPFNDLVAVERALTAGDVACVLTEPALTNAGIVLPDEGFHQALRELCTATSTVLIIDEAHTLQCSPGGLTRAWGLQPDVVTLGNSIGGGIAVGAYGIVDPIADLLASRAGRMPGASRAITEVAVGGTFCASALQTAACRAVLEQILTDDAYARTAALGQRLADGIERRIDRAGISWSVTRLPGKAAYRPITTDTDTSDYWRGLSAAIRVWFANRGVWEAIRWSGPAVSIATSREDVDLYLELFGALLDDLTR